MSKTSKDYLAKLVGFFVVMHNFVITHLKRVSQIWTAIFILTGIVFFLGAIQIKFILLLLSLIGFYLLLLIIKLPSKQVVSTQVLVTIIESSTIGLFLISIIGVFTSPFWIIGVLIALYLGYIRYSKYQTVSYRIPSSTQGKIVFASIVVFALLVVVSNHIPTISANADFDALPNYPSQWSAVESYSVYGEGDRDREHVIPRSWFDTSNNFVNDYVNVIWSNQRANNYRGNLTYCEVEDSTENVVRDGSLIVGYRDSSCFMPTAEYKGDVARITLYMYVTYQDHWIDLHGTSIDLMKKWSALDPVDEREKRRNRLIMQTYGYGNKFVDNPRLVLYVH